MAAGHWVIVAPGTSRERIVPVRGRLLIGRQCIGVAPELRLIVDDPGISRDHCELRVDPGIGATLADLSSNGTRVNGIRVQRNTPSALRDGDLIELGGARLEYRLLEPARSGLDRLRATLDALDAGQLTIVPGDALESLTERELEILALIAQGHSNTGIADRLSLSRRTVEAHVRNIMLELSMPEAGEANRRVQVVLAYLRSRAARPAAH